MTTRAAARKPPSHPALVEHDDRRSTSVELKTADHITAFAGSMRFVYIHIVWFSIWLAFVEGYPFPFLTMLVSLEAIFLSTFVMISQNRADEKRQALADHQWQLVQTEERQNEELLDLSRQTLELTRAVHGRIAGGSAPAGSPVE